MRRADHGANTSLGYPEDARLLLVNADDFGMYAAINEAVVRAFAEGIVRSTSLMVPCSSAPEAMRLPREHPDGWPVRQSDLAFLVSPQAREIILVSHEPLQADWQRLSA